jgi:hypothetical protein
MRNPSKLGLCAMIRTAGRSAGALSEIDDRFLD